MLGEIILIYFCVVCSVVSQDSVFDFVEPTVHPVISSVESEEESIYDRPPPARGLLCFPCVCSVDYVDRDVCIECMSLV